MRYDTEHNGYKIILPKKYPQINYKLDKYHSERLKNSIEKKLNNSNNNITENMNKVVNRLSLYNYSIKQMMEYLNLTPLHKPFQWSNITILELVSDKLAELNDKYDELKIELSEHQNKANQFLYYIDIFYIKMKMSILENRIKNLEKSYDYLESALKKVLMDSECFNIV